jgi:hemoglobin
MTDSKRDISDRADLSLLIKNFYMLLMTDPIVKHFFIEVRVIDLEEHIPRIVNFWDNLLFQTGAYKANAMEKHFQLHDDSAIKQIHFDQWLQLFKKSVDSEFEGEKAELAKLRAEQVAGLMAHQMSHR